jgi:uncharacterized membrane protein
MQNSKMKLQKSNIFSVREIAYLSLIIAACVVGRTAFQFIPNVQPMTDIFLIITIQQGMSRGLIVSLLAVMITNLYMGMGIWTISQLISYGLIIILTGFLAKIPYFKEKFILQIVFSFVVGLLYGFIISCVDAQILNISAFLPYYLQGVSFDLMHAAGNAGFYILLAPIFMKLLPKIKQ